MRQKVAGLVKKSRSPLQEARGGEGASCVEKENKILKKVPECVLLSGGVAVEEGRRANHKCTRTATAQGSRTSASLRMDGALSELRRSSLQLSFFFEWGKRGGGSGGVASVSPEPHGAARTVGVSRSRASGFI